MTDTSTPANAKGANEVTRVDTGWGALALALTAEEDPDESVGGLRDVAVLRLGLNAADKELVEVICICPSCFDFNAQDGQGEATIQPCILQRLCMLHGERQDRNKLQQADLVLRGCAKVGKDRG